MGLDPGLGYLHADENYRDSLACDIMEPVRPQVDAFVFDWISGKSLKREWFFEQRNGNCRLMADFASMLSETAPMWRQAVAPYAEWLAHTLWSTLPSSERKKPPATRLTQRRNREAQGGAAMPAATPPPKPKSVCKICATSIRPDRKYCGSCAPTFQGEQIREAAKSAGTVAAHTAEARALASQSRRRHAAGISAWDPASLPDWLTPEAFIQKVQPMLANVTTSADAPRRNTGAGQTGNQALRSIRTIVCTELIHQIIGPILPKQLESGERFQIVSGYRSIGWRSNSFRIAFKSPTVARTSCRQYSISSRVTRPVGS
jgi:hypothetical protein